MFQKLFQPTPERHEDGEEDRAVVVEEVGHLGEEAGVRQLPEVAEDVTHGAHRQVADAFLVADLETETEVLRQLFWVQRTFGPRS